MLMRSAPLPEGVKSVARPRGEIPLTFGERVLIIYFCVFYFIPMIMDGLLDLPIKYYLSGDRDFFWAFLFALVYLTAFLLILRTFFKRRILVAGPVSKSRTSKRPRFSLIFSPIAVKLSIVIFFVISLQFADGFDASFRHTATYSASGIVPVATFALKAATTIFIFASISDYKLIKLGPFFIILYSISIYNSFVGSYDIVYFFIAIYALIRDSGSSIVRFLRRSLSGFGPILLLFIVPAVVFAGMWNKIGFDNAVSYFASGGLLSLVELLSNRLLYHSYSLATQLGDIERSFALSWQAFDIVSFQTVRRLYVLLGESVANDTLQTVSRLNFLEISGYRVASDAGASPGLLGSLFYMLGSVYALPLHMLYVLHVIRIFDNIMGPGSYNLFAYFGALILFQLLVDSIPDNFNPFSIGFIGLVTLSLLSVYTKDLLAIRQSELGQHAQV